MEQVSVEGAVAAGPRGVRLAYDPALDGLRALAVVAVLLFHAAVGWAGGGFLGVDLFFVLSGYLITTLLVREHDGTGGVDLRAFWGRRARRLLPALLAVVAWALVYLRWVSSDPPRSGASGETLAALLYVANWHEIWSGADYFDQFGAPSPLLHTWSVAIEEQWYVVWPVALLVILALSRRWRFAAATVAVALAAASAAAMVLLADPTDPGRAYYGTDTRAQALLVGAALALVMERLPVRRAAPAPWLAPAVGVAGLAGWVTLVVTVDEATTWLYQGGFTLAALSATVAIAGVRTAGDGWLRSLLGAPPLALIGRLSYGLYLWHWPLYLLLTPSRTGLDGAALVLVRLGATLLVAGLSYVALEQPIRSRQLRTGGAVQLAGGLVVLALLAVVVVPSSGADRPPDQLRIEAAAPSPTSTPVSTTGPLQEQPTSPTRPRPEARKATSSLAPGLSPDAPAAAQVKPLRPVVAPGEAVDVLVVGDSVYVDLSHYFDQARFGSQVRISADTRLGCGTSRSSFNELCDELVASWAASTLADTPDLVMLPLSTWDIEDAIVGDQIYRYGTSEYTRNLLDSWAEDVEVLGATGARVVMVSLPCTQPENDALGQGADSASRDERTVAINALAEQFVADSSADVVWLDIGQLTCPGGQYQETINGVPMHKDGIHYTLEAIPHIWEWLVGKLVAIAAGDLPN